MKNWKAALGKLLDQPAVGFAPWILLSVVEGPGRVVLACGLAAALALLTCVAGAVIGQRPKLLDLTAMVFFAALAVLAGLAGASVRNWLGLWSGELSNAAIAAIAGLSLAVRKPFTLAYARESTDRKYWNSPLFLRINDVITAVWSAAFLLTAIAGYIGDGPLHQPDNIWTDWIIQIALVVLAIKFTGWYPDHATADPQPTPHAQQASHAQQAADPQPSRPRPVAELFRPVAAYLMPAGILVLFVGGRLWWAGFVLIAVGLALTRQLHQATRRTATAGHKQPS
jgi:putative Ca2+/H+ antiporter (TMEM165/GDT1 family)